MLLVDNDCQSVTDKLINCSEKIARNAQEESMVQNRPITVVMGCADLTYSYISREVRSEGFPTEAYILEQC